MPRGKRASKKVLATPIEETAASVARVAGPTPVEIAARAYELFCQRRYSHGHDVDDWLRAEQELREAASPA